MRIVTLIAAALLAAGPSLGGEGGGEARLRVRVGELVRYLGSGDESMAGAARRELVRLGPRVAPFLPDADETANPILAGELGRLHAELLSKARPKEALRLGVLWGEDKRACWDAAYDYARLEPRWTARAAARRAMKSLRGQPKMNESLRRSWSDCLDALVAARDREEAAKLAGWLLSAREESALALGCGLAVDCGDRRLDRQLLKVAGSKSLLVRSAALSALSFLRAPAPLPEVSDAELARLVIESVRVACLPGNEREFTLAASQKLLAERLPPATRARIWPAYLEAFRGGEKRNCWNLMNLGDPYDKKSRPWGSPEEFAVIRRYLADPDRDLRGAAAYVLGRLTDAKSYPRLAAMLRNETHPEVLASIANGISWHRTPGFAPALRPLLKHEDARVLAAAAAAAGVCGDRESIPRLVELLEHKDALVANRAAVGLRGFKHLKGRRDIRAKLEKRVLSAEDPFDYWDAGWTWVALAAREDLPAIRKYAEKVGQEQVYESALSALNPGLYAKLEAARASAGDASWEIFKRAEQGDQQALEGIRQGLRSSSQKLDFNATPLGLIRAAHFGFRQEGAAMVRLCMEHDFYGRYGIIWGHLPAHAAARLKVPETVPHIVAALRRSDNSAGTRIWALGEIGDRRAVRALAERGLDTRWVVTLVDDPRAFPSYHYKGWHPQRTDLLAAVTARALVKITGHRVEATGPEELAALWKRWIARNMAIFPEAPRPEWMEGGR